MFLWLVPISLQRANSANYGRNVMCAAVATNYLPSSNFASQSSEMRKSDGIAVHERGELVFCAVRSKFATGDELCTGAISHFLRARALRMEVRKKWRRICCGVVPNELILTQIRALSTLILMIVRKPIKLGTRGFLI